MKTKQDFNIYLEVFPPYEWTPVIAYEEFPKNRGGHSFHIVGETLVTWGGCYLDVKCFDDLYLFDIRYSIIYYIDQKHGLFLRLLVHRRHLDQGTHHLSMGLKYTSLEEIL